MVELKADMYFSPVFIRIAEGVKADKTLKKFANAELARFCEPYVPSQTNTLAQKNRITSEAVTYPGPYAHYQYTGEVYGPNFPIRENGHIIAWRSRKNVKKHPMGRRLHYSQQMHPLAQDHWDQAAMIVHRDDLVHEIKLYIADRLLKGR